MQDDGGFRGRSEGSDLYYTVFGLEGLLAIGTDVSAGRAPPWRHRAVGYLRGFGGGADLDFVHLACLARCRADVGVEPEEPTRRTVLDNLESYRAADGGYAPARGAERGTAYGCFLALSAYQDLGAPMPRPERMAGCIESLRAADGGYANQAGSPTGLTPATAAATCVLRELGRPIDASVGGWLLGRCGESGGFLAVEGAPLPDLLSTATALHALALMGIRGRDAGLRKGVGDGGPASGAATASLDTIRRKCLDFVLGLQADSGGFCGHWADDTADCEYTYYGLLALGHLAE